LRKILVIFRCDFKRRLKNPLGIVLMMLIPLVMTLLVGLVFGRGEERNLPVIKVLMVDEDEGFMSELVSRGLRQDTLAAFMDLQPVEAAEGKRMMDEGEASAMIIIPKGFTDDFLNGTPTSIRIVKNPSEAFLPMIVEEIVKTMTVVLDGAGRVFSGPLQEIRSVFTSGAWPEAERIKRILDRSRDGVLLAGDYVKGEIIAYGSETEAGAEEGGGGLNIYAYVLPGALILGLLFISEITLRDLVREKDSGTLHRIMTAPLRAAHVVAGKVMVTFCVTALTCVVIFVIAVIGFGVDLGRPLPLIVHFVGVILMCTGLMSFFYGFISSERTADAVMSVVIIVMALFGGSMVPFEQMGRALQAIGRFSPVYWAANGFLKIFIFDAGLGDIALNIVIMYGLGLATLAPGGVLLERKLGKGA